MVVYITWLLAYTEWHECCVQLGRGHADDALTFREVSVRDTVFQCGRDPIVDCGGGFSICVLQPA
ncbi:uncharacterized protein PHALS_01720 [Plasmopara halstedii]|uniref:Uncharacterized protein n=1 Tax=Plasmopara halstedii TaxID=4781 RepID=A0A0P1AVR2_PLAHL|nr:uncharacterized protein PHALS_01720 [Plasmopara halstedii]CEG45423.1 hypothetical protein PHALS_01720 [Plasmopara halstedii]|eukprot:XP_024581792.1 hypothetical protein PHALS_01720 [Plasmopara halstedii]